MYALFETALGNLIWEQTATLLRHPTVPTLFVYKRVLLKISGESLMGNLSYGIDPEMVARVAGEVKSGDSIRGFRSAL